MQILTTREFKVAELVARGLTEMEIADTLYVSPKTIHNHTYNIRKKIGARSAVDITREFILHLPDPKRFFTALAFLLIHSYTVWDCTEIDMRRIKNFKTTRILRNKSHE